MPKEHWHYLYNTKEWQVLRLNHLAEYPLCELHLALGRAVSAQVVDHIEPHKGDIELFLDPDNLQSLCTHCHDCHKQRQERTGLLLGNDMQGIPLDPNHPWNQEGEG